MAHDVFISYASADQTVAQMVCATLEQQGIRCWMAPRDVQPGDDWGGAIVEAIKASRAMVLVFSGAANDSRHIPREIERAIDREIPLVPVRIENVEPRGSLEYSLSSVHWLDAITPPVEAHLIKLAERLQAMLHRPAHPGPPPPAPGPDRRRALVIGGLVIAGIVALAYGLPHRPPTPATPPAQPSSSPSPAAPPLPTSTPAPSPAVSPASTLRVDPNFEWIAFPTHQVVRTPVDPRHIDDLKREANAYRNDVRPVIDLGDIFYDARQYKAAIDYYLDALDLTPDNIPIRIDLAMAYWHIKRNPEALSNLRRVLAAEPRNPRALLNLGVVYGVTNELEAAADCWRRVIEYQPGTWDADRAREMLGKIGGR